MGLFDLFSGKRVGELENEVKELKESNNLLIEHNTGINNPIIGDVYDGEKTPGEMGAIYDTLPNHLKLRLRAYDANLKTDIVKIITGKFFKWVVGSGLKLQAEPNKTVLGLSGVDTSNIKDFQKNVEALFNLYSNSKYSDYHKKDWLHEKANEAFQVSFLGGDCLCVLRVDKKYGVNVQVIDGQHICTPLDEALEENSNIKNGIEINSKGEHVAFWVKKRGVNDDLTDKDSFERIEAVVGGRTMAWMIYGTKHRIDHHRGIPVISSILEKIAKLDRYVEASVSKAEQTANLAYFIEHDINSTGENVLAQSLGVKKDNETLDSSYEKSGRTANMIRQSTPNQVFNMPQGSRVKSLSSPSETQFNEFFRSVFYALCSAVDIPPEVALQQYEQNYSSSRAAINGWEHIVEVYRKKFAKKFYEPFYRVWLETQILSGKIDAPDFLKLKNRGDFMAIEAYFNARFTGKKMPHIDPLKEAKAIRAMLGEDNTALISREQATENLSGGNWEENYSKFIEEEKLIPKKENDTKNTED